MKRALYFLVMSMLLNLAGSNSLFAGTDIKIKSENIVLNIDSLKVYNSNITFYKKKSEILISINKKNLEYIRFTNDNMIRYKSYKLSSYPGNVNLNVVNFFNGSFVSGTVNYIMPDSIYFTFLNDTAENVLPSSNISFINYGNSLIEEFVPADSSKGNQERSAESVLKKKYFGESDNETFIGVKAGYVSSWMNIDYETSNSGKKGFMLGGSYYNKFSEKAALDLSLMYVQKGSNISVYLYYPGILKEYQINFNYIEFQGNYQLLAPFKKWNLYFDMGLFMAEMIHASGIDKSAIPDSAFKIDLSGSQSNLNRFDIGLSLGAGASFKVKDHLVSIGIRYSDGWIVTGNTFNYNYYDLNYFRTQNYFSVYAAYGFRKKNKILNK